MHRSAAALSLALLLALSTSVAPRAQQDGLGRIDFPTSQNGPAQDAFIRGVLLLHSFEYEDAKEAFLEAQKAAPDFAMAYWGEAMTYNHPLWAQTTPEAAREPWPARPRARTAAGKGGERQGTRLAARRRGALR